MRRTLPILACLAALVGCGSAPITAPTLPASTSSSPVSSSPSIPGTPSPVYTWPASATCGRERWPVKVGTDPTAKLIGPAIIPATIAALDALNPPQVLPQNRRATLTETEIFRVHATLTGFKQEADSDYHLILSSGGKTMIAEIPDPPCAKGSLLLGGIEKARSQFDARYTPSPDGFTHVNVRVTVTGVGFFDSIHGQDGVASNGIELHPVLNITFGAVAPTPPPPPPAPSQAAPNPPASACYPTTPSGNCYKRGEFCSAAEHGTTGVAGDGAAITCSPSSGSIWRWS